MKTRKTAEEVQKHWEAAMLKVWEECDNKEDGTAILVFANRTQDIMARLVYGHVDSILAEFESLHPEVIGVLRRAIYERSGLAKQQRHEPQNGEQG